MLLFSFCVSSHIWQLPGNNWQSINWKLNQIDFKEQPLSSGLKYNLVEYRCKIQNADNYFEHETYLSWHDGPSLMVAYHIQNCDIKVFLIYLASWDAIEPGSLSDSKNWLDWCDPGEWRYLLKTLLMRHWRLMIRMKMMLERLWCWSWRLTRWSNLELIQVAQPGGPI